MGGQIFLTGFFGLFFAVGFAVLGFGLHSLYMSKQAQGWPTTRGVVTSTDFVVSSDGDSTTYRTVLSYTYNANGRELTGERIAFGYVGSSSENFHREIYEALPVNTQLAVRYDPSKPERAVLAYGANQSITLLILFGAVWTIFTAGMTAMFFIGSTGAGGLLENLVIYSRG